MHHVGALDWESLGLGNQTNSLEQALINNQTMAILILDDGMHIRFANQAAEAMLGISQNRLRGLMWQQATQYSSLESKHLQACIDKGVSTSDNEVTLVLLNGQDITVELCISPFHWQSEQFIQIELHRIDQQKKISREVMQHNQLLAARDLVRGLAHEIKNPLGGLRGAAQLLERELEQDEQKEFTQLIIAQADRLTNLVNRLLGPNRPPQKQWVNIHQVLEQVRQLVELDKPEGIRLVRDYDPSIPELFIDSEQLQQALLNIIRNAVQALQTQGEIRLQSRVMGQQTINGHRYRLVAHIRIIDNGPGIAANMRDTLFYPMVTGREGGTGLGLSIAQTLVHQHGGKIDCESRPGHTCFTLSLPIE